MISRWFLSRNQSKGMALIEMLAVIAIMLIIIGFVIPAVNRVRARAKQTVCIINLRQLAVAIRAYADDYGGVFPTSLYEGTISAYFGNDQTLLLCPSDTRDLSSGIPRGSYGLNTAELSSYRLTSFPEVNPTKSTPIPIAGDSDSETLDSSDIVFRHRGTGNIAFLDGHVISIKESEKDNYL